MKEIQISVNGELKQYVVLLSHVDELTSQRYIFYSDYDVMNVYVAGIDGNQLYPVSDDEYDKLSAVYNAFLDHTDVPGGHTCICGQSECVCEEMMTDCHNQFTI